ncbi:MAG: zinc-binding alcohol dehydrogenase [Longimicrobiales bacterium]|nr:zinc-binding alcohol dehydrogenase [Longimicrobiales bacterium]
MTTTPTHSQQFWVTEPGRGEIVTKLIPSRAKNELVIKTLYTAISRGTETLVFNGQVPPSQYDTMRSPFQEGEFPGPVKYGYSNVGICIDAPHNMASKLLGQTIFSLYPHQDYFIIPANEVITLPQLVPPKRAILAAGMETAVNAIWDSQPNIGDTIAVIGGGVIGLLVAYLCNRIPGTAVFLIDTDPQREQIAQSLNLRFGTEPPLDLKPDLIFHASGQPSGLRVALSTAIPESTVIELSWYGDQAVTVPLGESFHSHRLTLKSSQVSNIVASRRLQWNHRKRLKLALELLQDDDLDVLISGESCFKELPQLFSDLMDTPPMQLCHRIAYPD